MPSRTEAWKRARSLAGSVGMRSGAAAWVRGCEVRDRGGKSVRQRRAHGEAPALQARAIDEFRGLNIMLRTPVFGDMQISVSHALSRASTLVTLTHALVVRHERGRSRQKRD